MTHSFDKAASGDPVQGPLLSRVSLLLLLTAVAIAARASSFGNPIIQVDEEFYLLMARSLLHGALPYVDIWDRKPVGLFLTYVPAALLPPTQSVWAYQGMALASVVATALLIVRIAWQVGWHQGAVFAACFYILWLNLADGQGGQAPIFYNLLVASAVALVLKQEARFVSRARIAMLFLGVALQLKYTVLFEGAWIGLWLTWFFYRDRRSIWAALRFALTLCLIALSPTLVVLGVYLALGHAEAFIFANFLSIFGRHADDAADQIDNALTGMALLGPLVAMAGGSIGGAVGDPGQLRFRRFLYGWFGASLLGFAAFGSWYNHYTLPVMLPGAVCSAGFLARRRIGALFVAPAMLALFLLGQHIIAADVGRRGTRPQFAAVVNAIGQSPGSLYVDWGNPAFFTFTGRHALSPYLFPTHLQLGREAGAIGVDQATEIGRIFAKHPDVVVLMGPSTDTNEEPQIFIQVVRFVREGGYDAPKKLPLGQLWVRVYHRHCKERRQ